MQVGSPLWGKARSRCAAKHRRYVPCDKCKEQILKEHDEDLAKIAYESDDRNQ